MSFHLKLNDSYQAINRNPNMRPQRKPAYVAKTDWIKVGLLVSLAILVGCALALGYAEYLAPVGV